MLLRALMASCALVVSACATAPAPNGGVRQHLADTWKPPSSGPVKVAFFDADDTLRETKDGRVLLLPNRADALRGLARDGYLIAIASNQGGIAAGHVSAADVDAGFIETVRLIKAGGGDVHWLDYADAR